MKESAIVGTTTTININGIYYTVLVDVNGHLQVDVLTIPDNTPTVLLDAVKIVALAITPEALGGDVSVKNSVIIQALEGNTGWVKVGNATSQSYQLNPLDSIVVVVNNLNLIYIDVEVNGEGVAYNGS